MLAEWILSASVLTAAVLMLRLMFRRRISQKLQYWLWLPVLLRLLIPVPLFRAPVSVAGAAAELAPAVFAAPAPVSTEGPGAPAHTSAPASSAPAAATPADGGLRPSAAPVMTPAPAPFPAVTAPSAELPEAPAPSLRPAPAQPRLLSVGELLARLWLAGSLASGLWLLGVNLRFSQRLRAGRREKGRQGRLPVYISPEAASPCLFGLLRPAVYLTEACETVPEGQLRQILLHEETHYKQLDHLWGCLRCLALAVWWWNPLVWLAAVCSRRDGELSCDEKVMLFLGEEARLEYGRTLVALLPAKAPRPMLSAATLSGGARAMKERLDRIVKKPKAWVLAAVAVLLLALAAVGCTFAGKGEGAPVTPTPAPTLGPGEEWLLADRTAEEIDAIQYHLFTWETYTLRRGMEGFDEALDMLLALRGAPCGDPPAGPSVKRTLDFGKRVNLDYDGSALRGFFSDHWLDLSAMGRPDEELAAIFERYGEKYVPETRLADHGDQAIDGKMKVSAELPVYDYDAVQAAIGQRKRDYLAAGDRNHEPDASVVKLTLENTSEDDLAYGDLMLEVRRDGAWYRVWLYNDFGSQAIYQWLGAGETKERRLDLSCYDDPLTPGLYRVVIPYGVSGRSIKLNRIAWAEFTISDGVTEPEPWDGKEQLMGVAEPEAVSSILCRLPYEDRYTLREGDMGFAAARDFLFSLRGTPCERPDFLVLRSFEPDEGPAVTLGFDGERVYGCLGTGFWLLLDAPGRPDQELTDVFLRWGEKEVYTATYPSEYEDMTVDEQVTLTLDKSVVDRNVLLAEMAAYREEYMERGRQAAERFGDFTLRATLVNDSGETIRFGEYAALEMLQDGEWRTIPMRSGFGYFDIAHILEAGGVYDNLGVSFLCYYEEMLTPGRYRLSLSYKPGRLGNPDHVAFAEFELTDGPPQPMVYIPLWQDYPATEDHEAYHLNFRVPAGWSSVALAPEEAQAQGLLYLYNGTEDRHYIRDEAGKIIGAFGCMSYEETPGEETNPRAIYSSIAIGNGYRFDVSGSYAPLARRDRGESGRVKVLYSEAFLRPFVENAAETRKEGFLSYDRALGVYAAVELEPGVLTEEEMDTLARSLHMELEEPAPAADPEQADEPVARYTPEGVAFGSYEEARADTEAISFQWVDKPHTYEMAVKTSDPIAFDLEREFPGFGTLLCGHLPDDSPHGDPTYLFFLSEDGTRYSLPTPGSIMAGLPLDTEGGARASQGEAFQLVFPRESSVRWWTRCEAPVSIYGALYDPESMTEPGEAMFRGGTLVWDLDVSTMEVSIWFQPEV